ncbi:MAG TPA: NAD(P)-binding protein, partial [Blastocatellia bacterium]|nr:NAD(P)-binding protein [Blastocatellia bacterium]
MSELSTEIAIVGAGPAGAHLASRLSAEGREVVLFDPKGAWEKPCGGGVPTRAIREFSYLLESSSYPCKLVRHITLFSPLDRRVSLTVDEPFAIY